MGDGVNFVNLRCGRHLERVTAKILPIKVIFGNPQIYSVSACVGFQVQPVMLCVIFRIKRHCECGVAGLIGTGDWDDVTKQNRLGS